MNPRYAAIRRGPTGFSAEALRALSPRRGRQDDGQIISPAQKEALLRGQREVAVLDDAIRHHTGGHPLLDYMSPGGPERLFEDLQLGRTRRAGVQLLSIPEKKV